MSDSASFDDSLFEDAEMADLFSAFDEVRASETLTASALQLIEQERCAPAGARSETARTAHVVQAEDAAALAASSAETEGAGDASPAPPKPEPCPRPEATAAATQPERSTAQKRQANGKGSLKVVHGKRAARSRLRRMRVAAVAACLAFALTGGAAYAIPSSHVSISQDDTTVVLGVNVFGVTVSATSDDEAGKKIVEKGDLVNRPYGESLAHAYDSLEQLDPQGSIALDVRSGDPGQRERLETQNGAFLEQHPRPQADDVQYRPEGDAQPSYPGQDVATGTTGQPLGQPAGPDGNWSQEPQAAPAPSPTASEPSGNAPARPDGNDGQQAPVEQQPSQAPDASAQPQNAPAQPEQQEGQDAVMSPNSEGDFEPTDTYQGAIEPGQPSANGQTEPGGEMPPSGTGMQ